MKKINLLILIANFVFFTNYAKAQCMGVNGVINMSFTNPTLIAGLTTPVPNSAPTSVWKFAHVSTSPVDIDAIVTLTSFTATGPDLAKITWLNIDVPGPTGVDGFFQPSLNTLAGTYSSATTPTICSTTFNIQFVLTGTNSPYFQNLLTNSIDIDGGNPNFLRETVTYSPNPTALQVGAGTVVSLSSNTFTGPLVNQPGIGTSQIYNGYAYYLNTSNLDITYKDSVWYNGNLSAATRYHSAGFGCQYPGSIPFVVTNISGTVFNDVNGMTNSLVDGIGISTPSGTQLYVNLLNGSNIVVSSLPVALDGSYNFTGVKLSTNYILQLTTNQGVLGSPAPASNLPLTWSNSGESTLVGGNEVGTNINSYISLTTGTSGVNESNNFGINQNCLSFTSPISGGDKTICSGQTIPTLSVTSTAGTVVDWYNTSTGGALLLSGSNSYTPTVAGVYYAEARSLTNNCKSATRTPVSLTINLLPTLSLVNTTCATNLLTYSIKYNSNGIVTSSVGVLDTLTKSVNGIPSESLAVLSATLNSCTSQVTINSNCTTLISENFDVNNGGFIYNDNLFNGANNSAYADGVWTSNGGINNSGCLNLKLGGIDNNTVNNISGGWSKSFNLSTDQYVLISFKFNILQSGTYEQEDISEVKLSIDNQIIANGGKSFIDQLKGWGNTIMPISGAGSGVIGTANLYEFKKVVFLTAGTHTLNIGGYNNSKNAIDEITTYIFDDVKLKVTTNPCDNPANSTVQNIIKKADFNNFKNTLQSISSFGDRTQMNTLNSTSYKNAETWLINKLQGMGYTVEFDTYNVNGDPRRSTFVTKISPTNPSNMYIISAHFDGRGGGSGTNDDASGSSVILELAKIFADPNISTNVSIRFVFWSGEEPGLIGSAAYINNRNALRGIENPIGSGKYPEPQWLGMIQFDQVLFDHGLPAQTNQIAGADLDIEYQEISSFASQSKIIAEKIKESNINFSTQYPSEVSNNMNNTDSKSFQNYCPSVSIRDNRRVAEIGNGSNPQWHTTSDLYTSFTENDFLLGFNATQTIIGYIATISNAVISNYNCINQALNNTARSNNNINESNSNKIENYTPIYYTDKISYIHFDLSKDIYNNNEFINIKSIETKKSSLGVKLNIHPVPAKEFIIVTYNNKTKDENFIRIYDNVGILVRAIDVDINEFKNEIKIDLKGLKKGIYFITDSFGNKSKFILE